MKKLHIDFETRSEVDIKKSGALKYCADPTTGILCVSFALDDEPVQNINVHETGNLLNLAKYLKMVKDGEVIMSAFNAFFERNVFRFIIPRLNLLNGMYTDLWKPKYWQCTMAKSCACGLTGSLDVVCKLLGQKQTKDKVGNRIMLKMTKPRRPRKAEVKEYESLGFKTIEDGKLKYFVKGLERVVLWHESEEDFEALIKYCNIDVIVERNIDRNLPELIPSEQALWQVDQRINDDGIPVNIEQVKKAIGLMEKQKETANEKIKELTDFRVQTTNQIAKIKDELSSMCVIVDSLGADKIDELLKTDIPQEAKELLLLRKNNGKSSVAKYMAVLDREILGRVHGLFGYHVATTGRWGSHGIQLHNLPRGSIKDIDTALFAFNHDALWMYPQLSGLLSSLIRTVFIAPKNHDLIVADYAAIEARVLNWLAGQQDIVQKFIDDVDVYVELAKVIFNTNDIDKDKRFVGKQTELGSGYGMSPTRFQSQCEQYGQEISFELAEHCIKTYRKSHKKVTKFWYAMESAAKNAIRNKGNVYHCNGLYLKCSKKFLRIKLLSGRILFYFRPEIDDDKNIRFWGYDSQIHKVCKQYTYGAKLVENVVQATARDILANALMNLEGTEFKSVMHIHDEVVSIVKEKDCDIEKYCSIITELPDWAIGCPTKAEGWSGKYYKKD